MLALDASETTACLRVEGTTRNEKIIKNKRRKRRTRKITKGRK
jgi:hypothetical protein